MNIYVGADPELFMKDVNGCLVSAWGAIPGTKKDPFKVEKGAVQVDGMALEFNIDPALNEEEFVANINYVMEQMKAMIQHEFFISPVAHFGHDILNAQPKEALELGCDPDYNGWTVQQNPAPNGNRPFRTASGHVHVGWAQGRPVHAMDTLYEAAAVARQLDFYLGLPSILVDTDPTRRELYGKAGAFRNKPYGMEYRVLSNFWLLTPNLQAWVFRATQRAVDNMFNFNMFLPEIEGDIQNIINTGDVESARCIIDKYNLEMAYV